MLALRGGGTKGAFEVGVLKAMSELLEPIDIAYDVVEGVSIGGINAAIMALYAKGEEKESIERMTDIWATHAAIGFWEKWPLYIEGLLWKNSFFDNTRMRNYAEEIFGSENEFKRMFVVQSVDLATGEVLVFDETTPADKKALAVLASASIPGAFPPVKDLMPNRIMVDGGVFSNIELDEAILKCKNKGFSEEKIIVDMILCNDKVVKI